MLARVGSLFVKMLVTAILLPNYLGSELAGALNYPLIILFTGICTLGTDSLVTRQLLQNPEKENELLGSALRIRLIGGLVAIPLVFIAYYAISHIGTNAPAASPKQIAIMSLICIVQPLQIIDSYFQAKTQGKYIMYVQVTANILSAFFKLGLILLKAPVDAFIVMLVIDVLLLQIGYIRYYKKQGRSILNWKYNPTVAKNLLKLGWPLAFAAIFISLYMKIGQLMVDMFVGNKESGVYFTVTQLTESWFFIAVAITTSLFPAIMNFRKNQPALYQKRMSNLYDLMTLLSVSIATLITLFAPFFYTHFLKPEYISGAKALQVNAWAGVFAFLGTASGQYLIAEGFTKISLARTMFGAIAIIILNLLFIPAYGIMGAAYANVAAQAVATFSILLFPQTRQQGLVLLKSLFFINLLTVIFKRYSK
ncbi:Membrane protein involved in the export of O-antigen and teichoic acid [Sphingobacterium wenxiniae]|uniref:Membrane protein involved in the export of O-antigen and teichoic acid n=2 Tax=Sphingobacterium wenxiniae TaxID=683125 RepID=A0A1I6UJB7_9SPHI|nr:Membrane protein involved in the export of O-antigen and teichoic acid [Sphingobacterium wenxiniae]